MVPEGIRTRYEAQRRDLDSRNEVASFANGRHLDRRRVLLVGVEWELYERTLDRSDVVWDSTRDRLGAYFRASNP